MRDGPGWRAVIDLPFGTKADTAIKKRNDLAAGLELDEVQVWPERVRGTTSSATVALDRRRSESRSPAQRSGRGNDLSSGCSGV